MACGYWFANVQCSGTMTMIVWTGRRPMRTRIFTAALSVIMATAMPPALAASDDAKEYAICVSHHQESHTSYYTAPFEVSPAVSIAAIEKTFLRDIEEHHGIREYRTICKKADSLDAVKVLAREAKYSRDYSGGYVEWTMIRVPWSLPVKASQ
jgi:hypothetical protein